MQSPEIELKFPVADLARLQSRLPALGFRLDTPRTFEQNTLYDTPPRTLRQSKQILRLRRYGALWTVTHKRQPDRSTKDEADRLSASVQYVAPKYKVRIETETAVEDGPALGAIFEQLGYLPVFRYEKFRTEWSHATSTVENHLATDAAHPAEVSAIGHLVLDETPIGIFAELEGPPVWIDDMLALLGIDPAICLTDSYGKLFLEWKERTGSPAEHLTFDQIPSAHVLSPALG